MFQNLITLSRYSMLLWLAVLGYPDNVASGQYSSVAGGGQKTNFWFPSHCHWRKCLIRDSVGNRVAQVSVVLVAIGMAFVGMDPESMVLVYTFKNIHTLSTSNVIL